MIYVFGGCTFDPERHELCRASEPIPLRPKVFQVLDYLLTHHDRVVPRDELLTHVWPEQCVGDETLTSCVKAIRRAIGDSGKAQRIIKTVHGHGYRFVAAVETCETTSAAEHVALATTTRQTAASDNGSTAVPVDLRPAAFPAAPEALDPEYKPVTVLCCTLAQASELAARLGPETMHHLMETFFGRAQETIGLYGGSVIQYREDGCMALFGAPVAHEDHARRAVSAALELRQRLQTPFTTHGQEAGYAPVISMGLHTGPVIVGSLAHNPQQLFTAVGDTVLEARRLQELAAAAGILISEATHRLVQGEVRATIWKACANRGPSPLYTIHGMAQRRAGVPGHHPCAQSAFVGRGRELTLLHECLADAGRGGMQVVSIIGAPGLGKSRLLAEFRRSLDGKLVTYREARCLSYGQTTPYLVVRALLRQICGIDEADEHATVIAKVSQSLCDAGIPPAEGGPLLLSLLDAAGETMNLTALSSEAWKTRLFALVGQLYLARSYRQPLILAIEDVHWIDATSVDCLVAFVEQLAGAALLLLTTQRPGYQPPWMAASCATQLALTPLTPQESLAIVQTTAATASLPAPLVQQVLEKAAGNPFFLEELTRTLVEQDDPYLRIPDTVQAVLAARLDRLPLLQKRLLQTAATIGTDVPVAVLQAVTALAVETLHHNLRHLQASGFLHATRLIPDPVYTFRHALIQEVAYQALLERTRRQLHHRIATVLATHFPEIAASQPELLAQHYTAAGYSAKAVPYWQEAGQQAIARSAYVEAMTHLTTGMEVLEHLPVKTLHSRDELLMRTTLGRVLLVSKGYADPDVEQAFAQALELCHQVGETSHVFPALHGLWGYYCVRGVHTTAREQAERCLRLAQRLHHPARLLEAHYAVGQSLFFLGEAATAHQHLTQGIALYDPQQHRPNGSHDCHVVHDPGVVCHSLAAWTLWTLGYPTQARQHSDTALALAQELAHPFSLAYALGCAGWLQQLCGDVDVAHQRAEATLTLSASQRFPLWLGQSLLLQGWARTARAPSEETLAQMQHGLETYEATGAGLGRPYFLALLAEAHGQMGQIATGLRLIGEARELVQTTAECWWQAELHRLHGELLLDAAGGKRQAEAEESFQQALTIARQQQAKSLELRASMSLGRLWQQQGKQAAAYRQLTESYGWFTEGFDTADLRQAKALLERLAA